MNIFFCDIRGTFTGNEETRKEDIENLVKNLATIKETNKLDNLYFSFASSDHLEDVLVFYEEIKPYLEKYDIKTGPMFSSSHIYFNNQRERTQIGKAFQIVQFVLNNDVEHVYYADDSKVNHSIVRQLFYNTKNNVILEDFVLGTSINQSTLDEYKYITSSSDITALINLLELYTVDSKKGLGGSR